MDELLELLANKIALIQLDPDDSVEIVAAWLDESECWEVAEYLVSAMRDACGDDAVSAFVGRARDGTRRAETRRRLRGLSPAKPGPKDAP